MAHGIWNYYFHPISHVPGPFIAAVSPLWLMRAVYRKRLNIEIQELHTRYGSCVRIAPNEVSFATIEAQNTIHNPGPEIQGYFSKAGTLESMLGKIVWEGNNNVLTTTEKIAHKRLRTALLPAFTSKALFEQESVQQFHFDRLLQDLEKNGAGNVVNLTDHLSRTLWNIVGDLSFGEPLDNHQRKRFDLLKVTFCQLSPLFEALQHFSRVPRIGWVIESFIELVPYIFRLPTNILPSTKFRECLDRRDNRSDFLTAIMNSKNNGISLTEAEMKSNSSLLVMVGYDTTAATLSAIFYHLLRDPIRMGQLKSELRNTFSHVDDITGSRLLNLPFLNGCIHEALRLLPPANGKGTNRTSPGAMVDGTYIPAGVNVSADMYTIQRSPKYWAQPEEFRPERWFDNGPGSAFENDVRSSHRPFLLGPRVCLGKEVAMQSLRLAVAKLVFSFHFDITGQKVLTWETDIESSYLWIGYQVMTRLSPV
ncbi:cytochrome P450 3A19 [Bisporella sp. PMI_857]|nr:cytochrome P450 3A19 [Bisporella sp. PMI_857]